MPTSLPHLSVFCSFSLDRSGAVHWHSDFPRTYINLPRIILALRMEVIKERVRERERWRERRSEGGRMNGTENEDEYV